MQVGENDSVIVVTHEPNWLLDWYWNETTGKNVSHLIQEYLKVGDIPNDLFARKIFLKICIEPNL